MHDGLALMVVPGSTGPYVRPETRRPRTRETFRPQAASHRRLRPQPTRPSRPARFVRALAVFDAAYIRIAGWG
jgi:hypothetical protein